MKLLAFAASSSKTSINKALVAYAASLLPDSQVEILDLNDFELPLYSVDKEKMLGTPGPAANFLEKITSCDALIISFAEHNGSYAAVYKNLFDWCSRINEQVFQGKPMVLLSTSPGGAGAASVLATAVDSAPYFDGNVKATLSIPSFYENFDIKNSRFTNQELEEKLLNAVNSLL